nr:ferredoxin-thioredoxin reductase catalytic domain-containing protein [Candidatus Sigynarchaeum springense]
MPGKKTKENVVTFVTMTATKQNWKLHPDKEFLDMLIDGLMTNYNRYAYFSCPCRAASGVREKDSDIICPCAYCVPDQKKYGHCYCGLYLTPEFAKTGKKPKPIPERRPPEKDT